MIPAQTFNPDLLSCLDGSRHVEFVPNDFKHRDEPGIDDGPLPSTSEILESINKPDPWDKQEPHQEVFPYLDIYAQRGGVEKLGFYESDLNDSFDYEEWKKIANREDVQRKMNEELGRSTHCGFTAAVYETEDEETYYHNMDCRKHWCPICGGKGGSIHKHRKQAIFERVDVKNYNLRQLTFTIPEDKREYFKSRFALNQALCSAKNICKSIFGKDSAMIGTLHLFGDPLEDNPDNDLKFHPHVNVQIVEEKGVKLAVPSETLDVIRDKWRRALIGMGQNGIKTVNIDYEFKIKDVEKFHALKYFCRPTWGAKHVEMLQDDDLKELLVLGLKGFQYLRFWGSLSNCKYQESAMMTSSEKEEIERGIGKKLHLRRFETVDFKKMMSAGMLEEVRPNFYRLKTSRERRNQE